MRDHQGTQVRLRPRHSWEDRSARFSGKNDEKKTGNLLYISKLWSIQCSQMILKRFETAAPEDIRIRQGTFCPVFLGLWSISWSKWTSVRPRTNASTHTQTSSRRKAAERRRSVAASLVVPIQPVLFSARPIHVAFTPCTTFLCAHSSSHPASCFADLRPSLPATLTLAQFLCTHARLPPALRHTHSGPTVHVSRSSSASSPLHIYTPADVPFIYSCWNLGPLFFGP